MAIAVTSKEAYEGFKAFSNYIEQSTTYDEQKLELLQKCEDCIFEVKQEQMKQTRITTIKAQSSEERPLTLNFENYSIKYFCKFGLPMGGIVYKIL